MCGLARLQQVRDARLRAQEGAARVDLPASGRSASSAVASVPVRPIALALLMQMSMPPNVATAFSTAACDLLLVADVARRSGSALPPASSISSAAREDRARQLRVRLGRLRGDDDVGAVARGPQAMARPMPRLAPVMKSVRFLNVMALPFFVAESVVHIGGGSQSPPVAAMGPSLGGGRGIANRVARMDIFIQQIINGLVLGSVYAIVALGYTMVYGIISLINFAHGDVVMVGALTAAPSSPRMAGASACPAGCAAHRAGRRDVVCCDRRLHDRDGGLPAAAPRAAARAADHRDRRIDPASADAGHDDLDAATPCPSRSCCRGDAARRLRRGRSPTCRS